MDRPRTLGLTPHGRWAGLLLSVVVTAPWAAWGGSPPSPRPGVAARLLVERLRLVPGLLADDLCVVVRNDTSSTIALRGIRWAGYPEDVERWNRRIYGATQEQADGTVVLRAMSQQLSSVQFETGFLFPGEELQVRRPLTPQRGRGDLIIRYAVVPTSGAGATILLSKADSRSGRPLMDKLFQPVAPPYRPRASAGPALLRSTMRPGAPPVPEVAVTLPMSLPLRTERDAAETGGLSLTEALARAGSREGGRTPLAFYRPWLRAWVVVPPTGKAVALVQRKAGWFRETLPFMDPTAPDEFGALRDGATAMLLRANTFGDLVKVQQPRQQMYYDPGATRVPAERLWAVLRRARERRIPLRLLRLDPNGLGAERVLSAGVQLDAAGRPARHQSPR